jgi:hypothetical protein
MTGSETVGSQPRGDWQERARAAAASVHQPTMHGPADERQERETRREVRWCTTAAGLTVSRVPFAGPGPWPAGRGRGRERPGREGELARSRGSRTRTNKSGPRAGAGCSCTGCSCVEMAMGKDPLGITCPNPYLRRKNTPVKKLIPMTGMKFCPNPYPCGFRVPNGFPIPTNIDIKNNSSCKWQSIH